MINEEDKKFAEEYLKKEKLMFKKDWIDEIDDVLSSYPNDYPSKETKKEFFEILNKMKKESVNGVIEHLTFALIQFTDNIKYQSGETLFDRLEKMDKKENEK